jgi:hypothetical protein
MRKTVSLASAALSKLRPIVREQAPVRRLRAHQVGAAVFPETRRPDTAARAGRGGVSSSDAPIDDDGDRLTEVGAVIANMKWQLSRFDAPVLAYSDEPVTMALPTTPP